MDYKSLPPLPTFHSNLVQGKTLTTIRCACAVVSCNTFAIVVPISCMNEIMIRITAPDSATEDTHMAKPCRGGFAVGSSTN